MIKCETTKDSVKTNVCGSRITIMRECVFIIEAVRKAFAEKNGQESADDDIRECIKLAFMDREEVERDAKETKRKLMKELGIDEESLRKLVDTL